jgi:hypothetical protein
MLIASDLHQLAGVAQMNIWHGLRSRPNLTPMMMNRIEECCQDLTHQPKEQGDFLPSGDVDEPYVS